MKTNKELAAELKEAKDKVNSCIRGYNSLQNAAERNCTAQNENRILWVQSMQEEDAIVLELFRNKIEEFADKYRYISKRKVKLTEALESEIIEP